MNQVPSGPNGAPEPDRDMVQGKPSAYGGQAPRADWRQYARVTLWVVVAVITAVFLMQNRNSVTISFVFFEATVPLVVALLAALVLGVLLGGSFMWWTARRKRKAAGAARPA